MRSLSRVITWGHELLAEVIPAGGRAVDLTAGRGQDTLALWRMVGESGQVTAFDIQPVALEATQRRLLAAGAVVRLHPEGNVFLPGESGVDLVRVCHSRLDTIVGGDVAGVIANLGYLPGGDQSVVTRTGSTLAALQQALEQLVVGGRLAVVVYPGHPGGTEEAVAVDAFFSGLSKESFDVLHLHLSNRAKAPGLFVTEKRHP